MKITTLCFGNINRSPAAYYILKALAEEHSVDIEVDSAGTSDYNAGKRANKTMRDELAKNGYDMEDHRGKQITEDMVKTSDVILCMDPGNSKKLKSMFPDIDVDKIVMIGDFIPGMDKIPDPHFALKDVKAEVFMACYEAIHTGCYNIVTQIQNGNTITTDSTNDGMFGW